MSFQWRICAKIVAIIDLFFVSVQLLGSLMIIFRAGAASVANSYDNDIQGVGAWTFITWFGVGIILLQTGIGLWAALQLFKATTLQQRPEDAYQLSQNWQTICILFMLLSVISGITIETFKLTAVSVFIRVIFLFIVSCFMRDVDITINATRRQTLQSV